MLSFLLAISISLVATHQIEHSPAVWGDPAPDYSSLVLGDEPRFVYALLFVDEKITTYYEHDMGRLKQEVMKMVKESNEYFAQMNIGIVVVDILTTQRSNLSLVMFQEYRQNRMDTLPPHDFAALITMKYPGGLAYVQGICTDLAFYPSNPSAMGAIFFHEVAHLFGVPHKPANITLYVPNCVCRGDEPDTSAGCLKIPGFEHDCTAQQLANILYKNKCLRSTPLPMTSLAICGNGVLEKGEQCDCGKDRTCNLLNCVPETCSYKIHPAWMYLFCVSLIVLFILILIAVIRHSGFRTPYLLKMLNSLNCLKGQDRSKGFKNIKTFHPILTPKEPPSFPPKTTHSDSIVILLDKPPRSAAATLTRPKCAPPPPPPRARISVDPPQNYYEVPDSRTSSFSQRDDLSYKFEDFDSDDEGPIYNSYVGQPGVPTCPNYPSFSPINRVTVQFHGSGETMNTQCGSSSASSTALSGPTTPF